MEMGQEPQLATAGPVSSGAVGPVQLSAEDFAENEKRWNVPEVKQYTLEIIAAIAKAHQEHRNPLVKITRNHEGRIRAELTKTVGATRQLLVNAGMAACGIYHLIWLSGNTIWQSHVDQSTDMNIPKPDTKAPACLMFDRMVSQRQTQARQEGKEWVTFEVQRWQFRVNHDPEDDSLARMKWKIEVLEIELAALNAAVDQVKIIDLGINTNRDELRQLWTNIMEGTPIPAEGPFTVIMPLDMDEGPMGIKSPAGLNSELAMFVRVDKTNTAWVLGFTCTTDELDQEAALGLRHELLQAYDALICYALHRLEKPAKPIKYGEVLAEHLVTYEKLADVVKKIAANLKLFPDALQHFNEIRAEQVERAERNAA